MSDVFYIILYGSEVNVAQCQIYATSRYLARAAELLELEDDALYSSNVHYYFTYADPNV